ncbi:MAG: RIP metalloprotease RseP [Candidatus Buchananbacteria bacterium]
MLLTIVAFFLVLGVLVIVHELGHFFVARKSGVAVDEFGFGLPPRIFGIYKDETGKWKLVGLKTKETKSTIYSLNWIPMGGFVKIKGEEGEAATDSDSFAHKSVWIRMLIISAGVFMNVVLAVILLSIGLTVGSPQYLDKKLPAVAKVRDVKIRVVEILPDFPAAKAGLVAGDSILTIDNQEFPKIEGLQEYLDKKVGQEVTVKFERDQKVAEVKIVPQILSQTNKGGMGAALAQTGFVSYPWYVAWWYGLKETFGMIWSVIYGFYVILKNLIVSRHLIGEVYGPVGIATLVGDAARSGFLYVMQFTAVLSVIIAVINFLPFPALDGGRVFFLLLEAIRKKPINQKLEAAMHNIGFALLMILVVVVTFRDIARISSGFLNWWQKIIGLF